MSPGFFCLVIWLLAVSKACMLTVIIPNLNGADALRPLMAQLSQQGVKIILSDGGSNDKSLEMAVQAGARLVLGCCGRGHQLRRGARLANSEWLLFIHADSELEEGWLDHVKRHINARPHKAGYFGMKFRAKGVAPRIVEFLVGLRSLFLRLPYGDQGLLIPVSFYKEIGGYAAMPLFEDVDIIRKIGRNRLTYIGCDLTTDASKYESDGYFRRGWRNIRLARRYYKGECPDCLSKEYETAAL